MLLSAQVFWVLYAAQTAINGITSLCICLWLSIAMGSYAGPEVLSVAWIGSLATLGMSVYFLYIAWSYMMTLKAAVEGKPGALMMLFKRGNAVVPVSQLTDQADKTRPFCPAGSVPDC